MPIAIVIIIAAIWISIMLVKHKTDIRSWLDWLKQSLGFLRFQAWLSHKNDSDKNLALILGSGLLFAAFSGWVFGALAEDVLSRDSMTIHDAGVSRWLLGLATENSSQFF